MIDEINEHLQGWSNYFRYGYPRKAFGKQLYSSATDTTFTAQKSKTDETTSRYQLLQIPQRPGIGVFVSEMISHVCTIKRIQ